MREIIRLLKLKITKKNIHCKGNRWHSTMEPKETRNGHVCLLLLHELAAQCDPIPMRRLQSMLLLSPDLAHR